MKGGYEEDSQDRETRPNNMVNPSRLDKRKFERFPGKEGAMVGILSSDRTRYVRLVNILDLSKGGLAFECTETPNHGCGTGFLDILGITVSPVRIDSVPFRIVYRREVKPHSAGAGGMKRFGMEFGNLSENQASELDFFIKDYVVT